MSEKWIEIKIKLKPNSLETISSYLFALGCEGIQEGEQDFKVYFSEEVWSPDSYALLQSICTSVDKSAELDLSELEAENWNEKWKENFKPLHLTDTCVIVPDWEKDYKAKEEYKIIISPKMAFGTGHHETTQLILMLLPKYLKEGMRVLDAGTGSAILAIHAAQLNAKHVLAFDNDPVAIENARENIALNGFDSNIEAVVSSLHQIKAKNFDLILANINRNVLLDLAEAFTAFTVNNGLLVLSGLLQTDFEQVHNTYQNAGWILLEKRPRTEWLALVYQKN